MPAATLYFPALNLVSIEHVPKTTLRCPFRPRRGWVSGATRCRSRSTRRVSRPRTGHGLGTTPTSLRARWVAQGHSVDSGCPWRGIAAAAATCCLLLRERCCRQRYRCRCSALFLPSAPSFGTRTCTTGGNRGAGGGLARYPGGGVANGPQRALAALQRALDPHSLDRHAFLLLPESRRDRGRH